MLPEKLAKVNGFLAAMEEINTIPETLLYFQFQEIQFVSSVERSINTYYQRYAQRICYIGEDVRLLEEPLLTWFYAPTQPHTYISIPDERVTRFLSLLEQALDSKKYRLYEIELPFDFFGAFSEHYVIEQNQTLYLFTLSAA
ncbi:hypothetical protein CN918_25635 [Priestia megaterium]|nr:hypothetical protein CN918_25635 [Priestia megaterium]